MTLLTRRLVRISLGFALSALACKEGVGPVDPVPGNLFVRLTTPHATDAAVRVTLTGASIGALAPVGARQLYSLAIDATNQRVAIFGVLTTGDLFVFAVPDVNHPELYTVTLEQVATETNALRLPLTGYSLSIHD